MSECRMYDSDSMQCKSGLATKTDRFCQGIGDYPRVYKTIFCLDEEVPELILRKATAITNQVIGKK